MNKLCVNLVCKNEEAVIERCLRSCLPIVDSWCVVDTGSTDKTMEIVRSVLGHLPGTLHERPWVNFGHNKTEAMRLARDVAEFAVLMDADDTLTYSSVFKGLPRLSGNSYSLLVKHGSELEHTRPHLIRTALDFEYVEPVHEYLDYAKHGSHMGRLPGVTYTVVGGGARSADPVAKFVRDSILLEEDIAKRPDHARSYFYLAQSYRDAGVEEFALSGRLREEGKSDEATEAEKRARDFYEKSLVTYERRAAFDSDAIEEAAVAKLEAAKKREHMHGLDLRDGDERAPRSEVIHAYLAAWEMRPSRAEPLYEVTRYLRSYGDHLQLAYLFAAQGVKIPRPTDTLFLDASVYKWRMLDEFAVAAYWTGHRKEAIDAGKRLVATPGIPEPAYTRIKNNLSLAKALKS